MVKADHNRSIFILLVVAILFLTSCSENSETTLFPTLTQVPPPTITPTHSSTAVDLEITSTPEGMDEDSAAAEELKDEEKAIVADVVSVKISGSAHQYQFSIGISSPDTGCEQYADWWEVLSEDGELIYRRILTHSHINEQPFTRSGGPVDIESDKVVIIRAHMNEAGYGGTTMTGSVDSGFVTSDVLLDIGSGVENEPPLPTGCNF